MNSTQSRVVLSCDTANEVDDQFAITYALGSPDLDVRGVVSVHNTTVHGTASRDRYQEEAKKVVRLCGRQDSVACVPGAAAPLDTKDRPMHSAGLEYLIEEARATPLTIIATGPATDVASLLLAAPEVQENVRVVWLGGFGDVESYERWKRLELNGRADVSAWRVLWETPVNLLQVPTWPTAEKVLVESELYAEKLRALDRPIAAYLADILAEWVAGYDGLIDPPGQKILWDIVNVAAIVDPETIETERTPAPTLDGAGAHDFTRPEREIEMATSLDAPRVLSGFWAALRDHL